MSTYKILLTQDPILIQKAQELRTYAFGKNKSIEFDNDPYDPIFQHLLIMKGDSVIGTYRLLLINSLENFDKSCIQINYDISALIKNGYNVLEMGRACVHPNYKSGYIILHLWRGIAQFIKKNKVDYLTGAVSFEGTDIEKNKGSISYIYKNHLSNDPLCPTIIKSYDNIEKKIENLKITNKETLSSLPPLIKGYIRSGAKFAKGVSMDYTLNTTDLCSIISCNDLSQKIKKKFIT